MARSIVEEKPKKFDINKERERDLEKIRGVFHYHEQQGGTLSFDVKKYRQDKLTKYTLVDGQVYTLPRMIVNHLKNNCYYPIHSHYKTEDNSHSYRVTDKIHRTGFEGLDFSETTDMKDVSLETYSGIPAI